MRAAELQMLRAKRSGEALEVSSSEKYFAKKRRFVEEAVERAVSKTAQHLAIASWTWDTACG